MGKTKIQWNSERILSLTAMGMSFLTLIIFIYQTNLMSKQNYLSILPYVQLSTYDDPKTHSYQLSLKNHGVGPAILESVTILYKGQEYNLKDYNNERHRLLIKLDPALDSLEHFAYSTLDRGNAIPANTSYPFISIENSPEDYKLLLQRFGALQQNGLRYEIVYRSIQEERWIIHESSVGPEKLD